MIALFSILKVRNTKKHIDILIKYRNNSLLFEDDEYVIEPKAAELSLSRKPDILDLAGRSISDNLRYGNFYQQLSPFYEVFGDDGMIFLDGTNMGTIFKYTNPY